MYRKKIIFLMLVICQFKYFYSAYRWEDERCEALAGLAVCTIGCGYFVGKYFEKVLHYNKRILERLERDKKILSLLESI